MEGREEHTRALRPPQVEIPLIGSIRRNRKGRLMGARLGGSKCGYIGSCREDIQKPIPRRAHSTIDNHGPPEWKIHR